MLDELRALLGALEIDMRTVPEEQHLPCPFCGSDELSIVLWADDDGEFDALECDHCKAAAPLPTWDQRATDRAVTATA